MIAIKKIFRWSIYALALVLTLMIVGMAVIRFIIFPNIDQYKQTIATKTSEAIGQKVTIGSIITGWDGVSPHVSLRNVDIYDAKNRPALHLKNIEATPSWLSVPLMRAYLSDLTVHGPKLTIRREADGSIYLAGVLLKGEGKPDFANWLLSQAEVNVKNASITWIDNLRQAPPLSLNNASLTLRNPAWRNIFGQHLFSLAATPSAGTKQPIEINGSFFGRDVSNMQKWRGKVYVQADDANLTAWKPWIDYPIDLQSGIGNTKVWITYANKHVKELKAYITLTDLAIRLSEAKDIFNTEYFSGLVKWEQDSKRITVSAQNVQLKSSSGLNFDAGTGHVSYTTKNGKPWVNAALKLDQFNLGFINKLRKITTLPAAFDQKLKGFSPSGTLKNTTLSWEGTPENPSRYHVKTQFESLNMNAYNDIPGFKNISGHIEANQEDGTLELASTDAMLNLKGILRWPIPAKKLTGKLAWKINNEKLKLVANNIFITSPHITGTVNASYDMNGVKGGYLELSGKFGKGNPKYAPFYYPLILGKSTLHWLDSSILSGKAEDVLVTVKGHLDDFPFVNKQNKLEPDLGIFRVTAKVSDAVLKYGSNWPEIKDLGINLLFEGKRMELNAYKGHIFGNKIIKSKTTIAQLDADWPMLIIVSDVEGPITDSIKFVNESPVKQVALGFTDDLKTAGNGKLHLKVEIPLERLEAAKYKGLYKIDDGTIYANATLGIPEISKINGNLSFNEIGLSAQNIDAETLGGPAKFDLSTSQDKTVKVSARGTITDAGLQKLSPSAFAEALHGSAKWSGEFSIKKPLVDINIRSNLVGMAINLPTPIGKTAEQEAVLVIKKQANTNEEKIEIAFNEIVSAKFLRRGADEELAFDRGDIGIYMPAQLPSEPGLAIHGEMGYLNADAWLAILNKDDTSGNSKKTSAGIPVSKADVSIQKLDIFNRSLNALKITAKSAHTGLKLAIDSQELNGDVEWQSAKNATDSGKIIARLKRLTIPSSNEEKDTTYKKEVKRLVKKYPALDIIASNFKLGKKDLGNLEINAFEKDGAWVIQKLKISNPDSALLANGTWYNWSRNPSTNLKFSLTASDVGGTLKRFGQPDAIKGGKASIKGWLKWPGSPHQFETDELNGEFKLEASKGQIVKVQPGVGRLLGLLSLQSLPRRLSLDFRDLFSEGFAFDKISATATIDNGVMRSDNFFMTGPAAETEIKGETNLKTETQRLEVKVVPHVSDTLSLAALAGGPIAGVAAFVAQKLLKDPLNKIGESNYTITGTWDNPQEVISKNDAAKPKVKQTDSVIK